MHPAALAICRRWKEQLDTAKSNDFTVRAVDVDIILRWISAAARREKTARRAGEDRVLHYFIERLPQRQTKKDWMPLCCMATVQQIAREVKNRQRWE